MARQYWILKTEPGDYSWDDLVRDGRTPWDGVRNYQARNNLQAMRKGDRALIYHSVGPRELVGVARVVREAYPDPTVDDDRWVAVDVAPDEPLPRPVSLKEIKGEPALSEIALVRNSRLSVSPLSRAEFDTLRRMARGRS